MLLLLSDVLWLVFRKKRDHHAQNVLCVFNYLWNEWDIELNYSFWSGPLFQIQSSSLIKVWTSSCSFILQSQDEQTYWWWEEEGPSPEFDRCYWECGQQRGICRKENSQVRLGAEKVQGSDEEDERWPFKGGELGEGGFGRRGRDWEEGVGGRSWKGEGGREEGSIALPAPV